MANNKIQCIHHPRPKKMQEKFQIPHKNLCLVVFIISCLLLSVVYYDNTLLSYTSMPYNEAVTWDVRNVPVFNSSTPKNFSVEISGSHFNTTFSTIFNGKNIAKVTLLEEVLNTSSASTSSDVNIEYLVSNSKCKMPNFSPFNNDAMIYYKRHQYTACSSKQLLTNVNITDNIASLYIDTRRVPSYSSNGVTCCYSNVTRALNPKDPDGKIKLSSCTYFNNNINIPIDPVYVKCLDLKSRRQVYENVHAATVISENVQKKINNYDNTTKTFSVLLVGIDSISRLNFIRSLPNTYNYVEENGWIPLKGYNKMGDNTFPNLMAILTGYNNSQAQLICDPTEIGKLDDCPLVWYDYRNLGYVTAYAEDEGSINTFNYRKKGFSKPPVDYYYRPYVLATERLAKLHKDGMTYCTGPESAGERIMNLAKNFAVTFKNYPNFGFFWMNSFSHNHMNSPSGMDNKIKGFWEEMKREGVTENSIVIFISDHGMRFGNIRRTYTGWLEERLPFIYVSFPSWFKENFPKEYENFKINSNRLTSPYDLHMTLKHILVLSGRNFNVTKSSACPTCKSLFEEAKVERSCADAGIAQHWCTCAGYKITNLDNKAKNKLSAFLLNTIRELIRSKDRDHKCAKYVSAKVLETRISQNKIDNKTYILFQVQTNPKAIYESTVSYVGDINTSTFSMSGDISRLDSYNEYSKCVGDAYLKKYCYCRSIGERI